MTGCYRSDLAYIQAVGFDAFATGAAPHIIDRLRHAAIDVRRVVDAGCGAGALTGALVASGFDVTAIDQSRDLLDVARARVPGARFVHASIYDAALPPSDAVLAIGEPLTYHDDASRAESAVRSFFDRAAAALPPGGQLIFDVIVCGAPELTARSWRAGDDWACLVDTVEDAPASTLVRTIETFRRVGGLYRRDREIHRVRLFDADTMRDWLSGCGFRTTSDTAYGSWVLGPRRRAYFASRV